MARSAARSLTSLWKDRSLNLQLKNRLMQSLVWSVATYDCESWTINAADRKRLNAFEMDMYRRMSRISWTEHRTNNSILEELEPARRFLAEVKRRKLQYFGHVVREDNLCTHVLHGIVAGKRRRGRPRRRWTDNIKQWTGISVAECVQHAKDRTKSLGVRVSDLRPSVMRMDLGKARQVTSFTFVVAKRNNECQNHNKSYQLNPR